MLTVLPLLAATSAVLLGVAGAIRKPSSHAAWFLLAGTVALALDTSLTGAARGATDAESAVAWLNGAFLARAFEPLPWLGFALTYSRGDYRNSLRAWRAPLAVLAFLPLSVLLSKPSGTIRLVALDASGGIPQFGAVATVANAVVLVAFVLILMNLEQTFRASVGTMRWRIKLVVVGTGLIFGTRVYTQSQSLLYSSPVPSPLDLESASLLVGVGFLIAAYTRSGWDEIDIFPSRTFLTSSLTLILVGGYLLAVGVLAQVVRRFGGAEYFQIQALVVLAGMSGLALLLLSNRVRQRIQSFAARHFRKAQYDSVRVWALFSERLSQATDQAGVCRESARLISQTFDVLSVAIWVVDEQRRLRLIASTTPPPSEGSNHDEGTSATAAALEQHTRPFELDSVQAAWAGELRDLNPATFSSGGNRWCVPLVAGRTIGVVVLADRVNATGYSEEELELLTCIGQHVAAATLSLRLGNEVAQAREMETLRTMSAFFVHDLKNAAASLNLMLRNLPLHFDDPAFRADILRGVGNTAKRIDEMIARLTALREQPDVALVQSDLNDLVAEALKSFTLPDGIRLTSDLGQIPKVRADRAQLQSVVTNLVLNAQDALGSDGRIDVRTDYQDGRVLLSVADDGCGMSPEFVRASLFRPFQSTKRRGLGIGLFQSRTIVEAHGGLVSVESEPGKGTVFLVSLPVGDPR